MFATGAAYDANGMPSATDRQRSAASCLYCVYIGFFGCLACRHNPLISLVGAARFELAPPSPPDRLRRSSRFCVWPSTSVPPKGGSNNGWHYALPSCYGIEHGRRRSPPRSRHAQVPPNGYESRFRSLRTKYGISTEEAVGVTIREQLPTGIELVNGSCARWRYRHRRPASQPAPRRVAPGRGSRARDRAPLR